MFCTKCGTRLDEDCQFCTNCGALTKKSKAKNESFNNNASQNNSFAAQMPLAESQEQQLPRLQSKTQMAEPQSQAQAQLPNDMAQQYVQYNPSQYNQAQYNQSNSTNNVKFKGLAIILTSIILVVAIVAGGVIWYFATNKKLPFGLKSGNTIESISDNSATISAAGKEYKKVLSSSSKYEIKDFDYPRYYYTLWDIDNDGIPELIVKAKSANNTYEHYHMSVRVFSFKNNKLVAFPEISDMGSDETNRISIYLNKMHKGLVTFRAIYGDGVYGDNAVYNDDGVYMWEKTTYTLKGERINKEQVYRVNPLDPKRYPNGTNELKQVIPATFVSVNDLSDITKMINANKMTNSDRIFAKTVQEWREKGYQVFTGKVKVLTAEEAYDSTASERTGSDNKDLILSDNKNKVFTVLTLDRNMSVNIHPTGMDSDLLPSYDIYGCDSVLLDKSNSGDGSKFADYANKEITVAVKGGVDGGNWESLPYGVPTVTDVQIIKK